MSVSTKLVSYVSGCYWLILQVGSNGTIQRQTVIFSLVTKSETLLPI